MLKGLLIAPFAALLVAGTAQAAPLKTLTLNHDQDKGLHADVIEVHTHRNPGAVIATDALYGGIAGLAIGAGVALLQNDGNWGRDLAIGAGVGLLVGGIFGAVDVATSADRAFPIGENRNRGFSRAFGVGEKF